MKKIIKRLAKLTQKQRVSIAITLIFVVAIILVLRTFVFHGEGQFTPTAPTNLVATDNSDKTQIFLRWVDNASDETGFKVERTPDFEHDFQEIVTLNPNTTTYTDSIGVGKRYYYRIRAFNALGGSDYSNTNSPTRDEPVDFLMGQGNFENPVASSWLTLESGIGKSIYSWASPNNEVASGWTGIYDPKIDLSKNIIAKNIKGGGVDGSNAQYFGIKDYNGTAAYAQIGKNLPIGSNPALLTSGNKLILTIDQLNFINNNNLPLGTSVSYDMYYQLTALDSSSNNQKIWNYVPLSSPLRQEIVIPSNFVSNFAFSFSLKITVNGNLTGYEPGFQIDNAHLYLTNSSDNPITWQIPAPRNRDILTHANYYCFGCMKNDFYWAAEQNDYLSISDYDYNFIPAMKLVNPNMKFYIYESANITDERVFFSDRTTNRYEDHSFFKNSPIDFVDALDNHPDWFKTFPANTVPLKDGRKEELKYNNLGPPDLSNKLNYVFHPDYPTEYMTNLDAPTYKETWASNVISRIQKYKVDGVFVDEAPEMNFDGIYTDPSTGKSNNMMAFSRSPNVAQFFSTYIASEFRKNGIGYIINGSERHLNTWPGESYLNPTWDPATATAGVDGVWSDFNRNLYQKLNRGITPDTFFNEAAFIGLNWKDSNTFNMPSWLNSLDDMDQVISWNQGVLKQDQKKLMQNVIYYDRPDLNAPANGENGTINFALTTYLLGESEFSSLSIENGNPAKKGVGDGDYNLGIDFSDTKKLGAPLENRIVDSNYPDKSLQSRKFINGLVITNGSPDQPRNFILTNSMLDKTGTTINPGTLTLLPHTGRILFNTSSTKGIPDTKNNPSSNPKLNTPGAVSTTTPTPTPTGTTTATDETTTNPSLESTDFKTPIPEIFSPNSTPSSSSTVPSVSTTTTPFTTPSETISNEPNTAVSTNPTNVQESHGLNWKTIVTIIIALLFAAELIIFFVLRNKKP
ncbi:MAG: hypothetical protein M1429_01320 [Patescibacteria group bacterium]|nr:hypothetical protein [Patescibacteria group bacterium]